MPLPGALTYGRVVGRFILAVADASDPDTQPDAVAATGKVKFIPAVSHVVVSAGDPDPVSIAPQAIECNLDADGYLIGPNGARGVTLVASDNDAMTPRDWTYNVQFSIAGLQIASFSILITSGVEKDLALESPLPTSGGTTVVVNTQTKLDAEAARDAAQGHLATMLSYAPVHFLPTGDPLPGDLPDPCLIVRY